MANWTKISSGNSPVTTKEDYNYFADSDTGVITFNLPTSPQGYGSIRIVDIGNSTINNIFIVPAANHSIMSKPIGDTMKIDVAGASVELGFNTDTTTWIII